MEEGRHVGGNGYGSSPNYGRGDAATTTTTIWQRHGNDMAKDEDVRVLNRFVAALLQYKENGRINHEKHKDIISPGVEDRSERTAGKARLATPVKAVRVFVLVAT